MYTDRIGRYTPSARNDCLRDFSKLDASRACQILSVSWSFPAGAVWLQTRFWLCNSVLLIINYWRFNPTTYPFFYIDIFKNLYGSSTLGPKISSSIRERQHKSYRKNIRCTYHIYVFDLVTMTFDL